MAESRNGNIHRPFAELMHLQKLDDSKFLSTALAFGPANSTAAYGGHVFAQAVWAAAHTVRPGFVIHNVTGFFIRPGDTSRPFVYTVRTVREGGGYCTRTVDVVQDVEKGICFTCICSFKIDEPSHLEFQETLDLREKYEVALQDKKPEDWPEMPGVDSPWYWEGSAKHGGYTDPFPGLDLRKVNMDAYNDKRPPLDRRKLHLYSVTGPMPPIEEQPNLHACAHLYASDRNSLFLLTNFLDIGNNYTQMASLSHSVVFHVGPTDFNTLDQQGEPRWYCQEAWTTRAGSGRGMHQSKLWRERDGLHVASTWQEGLVRISGGDSRTTSGRMRTAFAKAKEKL